MHRLGFLECADPAPAQVWLAGMKKPVTKTGFFCHAAIDESEWLAAIAMLADKSLYGFQVIGQNGVALFPRKQISKMRW